MTPREVGSYGISRLGLHAFLVLTSVLVLVLICSGGLVTSKGVGMTVPDWPTSYGYNMFLFPVSRWVGGIFYEHTHRLLASLVGLMTLIATVWLLFSDPRRWVKVLGGAALVVVIIQGLLGGFRVTLYKDEIGIFHGMLAQAYFCAMVLLSIVTSRSFVSGKFQQACSSPLLRWSAVGLAVLIFAQLGVGATMRHAHAGLSIPDFPLAYGAIWPDTSAATLEKINEARTSQGVPPTTAFLINLQMVHRLMAVLIAVAVFAFAWRTWKEAADDTTRLFGVILSGLIVVQIALGAYTIWSNKAADVATAHVAFGALCLLLSVVIAFRLFAGESRRIDQALSASHRPAEATA